MPEIGGERAKLVVNKVYIDGVEYRGLETLDTSIRGTTDGDEGATHMEGYGDVENVINSTEHHCERLEIICWNINGGFSTKINDQCFQNFLLTYDIVLLTEC